MFKDSQQKFIKINGVELPIPYNEDQKEYFTKIVETIETEINEIKQQVQGKNVQVSTIQLSLLANIRATEKYYALLAQHKDVLDNYKKNIGAISRDLVDVSEFIGDYLNTAN